MHYMLTIYYKIIYNINLIGFVSGLLSESKEVAMTQLLLHLPLLRPGNREAKHCYLAVVPIMLNY